MIALTQAAARDWPRTEVIDIPIYGYGVVLIVFGLLAWAINWWVGRAMDE